MPQDRASEVDSGVTPAPASDARVGAPAVQVAEVDAPALLRAGPSAATGAQLLGLQRAAGNQAVLRLMAKGRAPAPHRVLARDDSFQDPAIQGVYDRWKPSRDDQKGALHSLDKDPKKPPGGAWGHISWADIAAAAAERVCNPTAIDQGSLGTCGSAAILNFEARVDPRGYADMVQECFTQGKLKGSGLNSKLLGNTPQPGMPVVDWMMLSGMQDRTNDWYQYYGRPEDKREGTTKGDEKWSMKKYAGAVETKSIDTPDPEDVLPATRKVNDLLAKYPNDVEVIMRVSSLVLQNPASGPNKLDHAIGLTKPAKITEDASGDPTKGSVEADVFTWAQIMHWTGTVRQFQHMVWGFTLASRTKGVL